MQAALYVFDPSVDLDHALTVTFETQSSDVWESLLAKVERERALIRNRAGSKP